MNRTRLTVLGVMTLVLAGLVSMSFLTPSKADAQAALVPLATDCSATKLGLHTGFQIAPACVQTSHGEVSEFAKNPQLLIVDHDDIREGQDFSIKVSTKNLVRDRFLAAGQGGYYLETGLLNDAGLTRGHFHTACRVLEDGGKVAPDAERSPVFQATEDGKGSEVADIVKVTFKGKDAVGNVIFKQGQKVQCMAWAGDGSHRAPLMQFANSMIAVDAFRTKVKKAW